MIINKVDSYYIIKLLNKQINIYSPIELEDITKRIIKKISASNKLKNKIHLTFYLDNNYGTIIKLEDYKSHFALNNDKTVKITIHTESSFLYKLDYFNIKKFPSQKIYYYKNKFYIKINNSINTKDYYKLLELSEIIYEDTEGIIDKAIKI